MFDGQVFILSSSYHLCNGLNLVWISKVTWWDISVLFAIELRHNIVPFAHISHDCPGIYSSLDGVQCRLSRTSGHLNVKYHRYTLIPCGRKEKQSLINPEDDSDCPSCTALRLSPCPAHLPRSKNGYQSRTHASAHQRWANSTWGFQTLTRLPEWIQSKANSYFLAMLSLCDRSSKMKHQTSERAFVFTAHVHQFLKTWPFVYSACWFCFSQEHMYKFIPLFFQLSSIVRSYHPKLSAPSFPGGFYGSGDGKFLVEFIYWKDIGSSLLQFPLVCNRSMEPEPSISVNYNEPDVQKSEKRLHFQTLQI